jgi:hypothetical protein
MKCILLSVILLLSLSLAAQTVYYDHPVGVSIPLGYSCKTHASRRDLPGHL